MKNTILYLLLAIPILTFAQDSTNTAKNQLIGSVNYQTQLHYFGRTDSLKSSGLLPSLGIETKLGLYATGNFIFINNATTPTKYVGTSVEAGYRFPTSKKFSGNVFYTQFIYDDKSVLVQSALKAQTGINTAFTNKIININFGGDLKFSNKTDVGATFGLDHLFIINKGLKNMAFAINPSAYVYAGTQNFSNTYLQRKTGILSIPYTQQTTENITNFNILSYEISLPIVFVAGKFNAAITPAYVLPQNLVIAANNPSQSERGENMFYTTFSIGFRL